MYMTSDAYRKNQAEALRNIYYEIEYGQIDPEARDSASVEEISPVTFFSSKEELLNERAIKSTAIIASLEKNQFILDGSRNLLPDPPLPYEVGVWGSSLAGEDGTTDFFCQIKTENDISAPGLTITFYPPLGQFAVDFDVILKKGQAQTGKIEVRGNQSVSCEIVQEITGCDRIGIKIKKWSVPGYYPKLTQVDFGIYSIFNPENLTAMSMENKASAVCESLPVSTLVFKFANDGTYDPVFETGKNKFIQDRQPIRVLVGSPKEQVENMSYELSGRPNVTVSEVEIKANSLIAKLDRQQPAKWKENVSLYAVAEELLKECGFSRYEIAPHLRSQIVTCMITENYRDTMADLLVAGRCVILQKKDVIHIAERNFLPTGYRITRDISAAPAFRIQDELRKVIICKPLYTVESISTLTTFNVPTSGEHIISIPPAKDISVSGGTLISSTAASVKVSAVKGAVITVSGRPIKIEEARYEFGEGSVAAEIRNNPFILDPQPVAEWLLNYYKKRQVVTTEWRQDYAIELLDVVEVESEFGVVKVVVEEQTFEMDGGMKGTTVGRRVV